MNPKEELKKIYYLNKNIKALEDELLILETMAKGGSITYKDKIQTSPHNHSENIIVKIVDIKKDINKKITQKILEIEKIEKKISNLDDELLEAILRYRYIKCDDWIDISINIGYSLRQIYRYHKMAISRYLEKNKNGQ